jgi:hypothetical protein
MPHPPLGSPLGVALPAYPFRQRRGRVGSYRTIRAAGSDRCAAPCVPWPARPRPSRCWSCGNRCIEPCPFAVGSVGSGGRTSPAPTRWGCGGTRRMSASSGSGSMAWAAPKCPHPHGSLRNGLARHPHGHRLPASRPWSDGMHRTTAWSADALLAARRRLRWHCGSLRSSLATRPSASRDPFRPAP